MKSPGHPWQAPGLASADGEGVAVRTVILRRVDSGTRTLEFYSDIRSPKIAQLTNHPRVVWLFYDPQLRTQLRITAQSSVHHQDALAEQAWQTPSLSSRRSYLATQPPGSTLAAPGDGLPDGLGSRLPTSEESEGGWARFALVATTMTEIDWLRLEPHTGHRRAIFTWDPSGAWQGRWVVP